MDIFQTILTALTTPNEALIRILAIPLTILDIYIGMIFFSTILNININKKQELLYVIIYGIIANMINFIIPASYTIFINIIIWPILIYFILKTTILKSILSEVIVLVTTSVLDFVVSRTLFNIFNIDYSVLMTTPIFRISAVVCIYFVMWSLAKIIKYLKLNINVIDNFNIKTKILLILNIILMLVVIGVQFYLVRFYSDNLPFWITLAGIIALVAYFTVSVYNLISVSKLETTSRDLEGAQLTIVSLRALHDTVRTFKHDFDNIVNSIGGYIRNEDIKGLDKYYTQLLEDCHKTNNLYTLSPNVINHPAIYNILAAKYYVADELNVQINLDIFLDLNEIEKQMKIYEFTRILGILLDNAIEAAKECDEKIINVTFRKEDMRHRIIVIIENTYPNKDVNIDEIFEKGKSSKKNNSGLGLWKVREILKRNNNLNLHTTKNEQFFKQQFEIYY